MTQLFPGAQCGIGPATDEGFFYDFVVSRPFVPEDLEKIEARMRQMAGQDLPYERQLWPRDEAIAFFRERGEPLKVQLIEEKTAGQADRVLLHDQGPRHVRGFLRRPARAVHRQAEGVQAAVGVERLLEGRRAQPADAAHLRHRVLQGRRSEAVPASDRGSEAARPSAARQGPRPVHVPSLGAGRRVLARQGHDGLQPARRLHARGALPRRLRGSEDAAHLQQGAVGDVRPLAALPREHVPGAGPA